MLVLQRDQSPRKALLACSTRSARSSTSSCSCHTQKNLITDEFEEAKLSLDYADHTDLVHFTWTKVGFPQAWKHSSESQCRPNTGSALLGSLSESFHRLFFGGLVLLLRSLIRSRASWAGPAFMGDASFAAVHRLAVGVVRQSSKVRRKTKVQRFKLAARQKWWKIQISGGQRC